MKVVFVDVIVLVAGHELLITSNNLKRRPRVMASSRSL